MAQRNYCFDIETPWGSHVPTLEPVLASLPAGSLVIEHGAGLYSSPVISRYPVRVVCIEEAPGWSSWVKMIYAGANRDLTLLQRAKAAVPMLPDAALVLVDGAARERGDLLKWSLAAGVPCIIAHDTEDDQYGYRFDAPGYAVTDDAGRPQTTMWRRL